MQKTKKVPQRKCIACQERDSKKGLIRIVKNKENVIKVDEIGKEPGRGAYICYNMECLKKAQKSKKIEKALGAKIDDEIYEQIKKAIENKVGGDVIG